MAKTPSLKASNRFGFKVRLLKVRRILSQVGGGVPQIISGPRRARTDDPRIKSPLLYQLS